MTARPAHEMLEEMQMQYNVVRHSLEQLGTMITNFRETVPAPLEESPRPRRVGRIKSLDAWVGWLRENGPAYRKDIAEATGMNLATNATAQVRPWREHMEHWDDGQLSADTLLNITGPRKGMGRPPVIYFLWSQRFDLMPRYGVGPLSEPDDSDQAMWAAEDDAAMAAVDTEPKAMTGVLQPGEHIISMAEVRDANGFPQRAWDFYGDIGEVTVTDDETDLTMDDLYNAWENAEPVDPSDGPESQSNEIDGDGNGDDGE